MNRIKVNIPEGTSGDWYIKTVTGDGSSIYEDAWGKPIAGKSEPHGEYTFLMHKKWAFVMQDTYHEYLEHEPLWSGATGNVLIGGLGLGLVNHVLINIPNITSVTIVEKHQEVIDLVWDHCPKDARFTLVHADIHTWNPPQGMTWDYAWFDTFTDEIVIGEGINETQYQAMIEQKYGNLCSSIGIWQPIWT